MAELRLTKTKKNNKPEPNKMQQEEEEDQVIRKPKKRESKPQKKRLEDELRSKNIGPSLSTPRKTNKSQPLREKPSLSRRPISETQQGEESIKTPARKSKPPITEEIKKTTREEEDKEDLKKHTEQRVLGTRKAQTQKGDVQNNRPDCENSRPRNMKAEKEQ